MVSLPPNRATTLKAAFRACDVGSLVGADIERYYVDLSQVRNTEAIQSVNTRLDFLEAAEFCTILFTGHRGCGKSTELRRIQERLQSEYKVIYIEADAELDILDAEYTDLYLVIIKKVADELYKLGLKFNPQLLNNFESWFKEITQENEETVEKFVNLDTSAEVGGQIPFISKLLAKIQAQIKGSDKQKKTIRQTLQKDIGRLQADINLLLGNAFNQLRQKYPEYQKGFLIVFDNLDRVPPSVDNHLFFDYAAQLQGLHCTIIYTAPISVVYSEKNLSNTFDSPNIVPMVNIYEFKRDECDLEYNQTALEAVASLIDQRVEVDAVFESRQQLLELAKASGGHVRQLMQITARAFITAATRGHNKVTAADVTYAIKQEQFNFERIIPTQHYSALARICLTKDVTKDEIGRMMLFNISVFEYNGDNRWNYVNPVVKQINAFQEALAAAKANL
ncbi:AAA family ATPase [Coleofasciculus sp. FACHB-1120]|uniref:AAA family ATPase n=1 Tax=Coleofasciculus sp. FACHB-1120 TaxID=2692783 RepID=UPI001686EB23|nr:AAA family ATPase [Coleofasciculus sp. FACHB-1120]MBD2744309.1 AAA family ATPase [Coleofasciculus sp. FACHB-1120]